MDYSAAWPCRRQHVGKTKKQKNVTPVFRNGKVEHRCLCESRFVELK